ncbi:pilus assembly FimT family protein [Magnetofaba australis]|uniref:Type II secretion system protein H n=1 Tax=Magnetofaba australis IT-1 TaxID=1434232 RepID=A0A1Y2KA19_9PROT|nr:GspH/FimT family pseudopilin [Magnetofaba australis]OSM07340.1 putative type II secretion system protein GspH [Magnetofaba australis IT-1]
MSAIDRGFSLIELLVVMAIMSIALAVVAPRFSDRLTTSRLSNAARSCITMAQMARFAALKSEHLICLRLSQSGRALMVTEANAHDVCLPEAAQADGMPAPRTLPESVTAVFQPVGGQQGAARNQLRFWPDGSSDAGTMTLAAPGAEELVLVMSAPLGRLKLAP